MILKWFEFMFWKERALQVLGSAAFRPTRSEPFTALKGLDRGGLKAVLPVTILVCARNEADNLRRHLPDLLAQQYDGLWELLLVDDASTDATPMVLRDFQKLHPERLRVIAISEKTSPGKKAALTAGIEAARFEWLLLTDADCRPASQHWLSGMASRFSEKIEIVLGYGPLKPQRHSGFLGTWSRFETVHIALHYIMLALFGMPYMGVGRNLAWRKSLFLQTGGFRKHQDLIGGDDDLFVNATARPGNLALCVEKEAFVFSEAPSTWNAWFRQKRRHLSAGTRYRPVHQFVLGLLAGLHALHYAAILALLLAGLPAWALGLYVLRLAMVLPLYRSGFRLLQERDLLPWLPLLDAGMAVYYGVVVPCALFMGPGKRWK